MNDSDVTVVDKERGEDCMRVMQHLASIYEEDGNLLPIKSKVLGKALLEPLPDGKQFGKNQSSLSSSGIPVAPAQQKNGVSQRDH